jgi:hypothetical protein
MRRYSVEWYSDRWIMVLGENGHSPIWLIISAYFRRGWGKSRKTSARIVGGPAEHLYRDTGTLTCSGVFLFGCICTYWNATWHVMGCSYELHSHVWHSVCVNHYNKNRFRLTQTTRLFQDITDGLRYRSSQLMYWKNSALNLLSANRTFT